MPRPEQVLAVALVVPFLLGAAAAPAEERGVLFRFADERIVESSGLAPVGDLLVTTNDSGDAGVLYAVDPASGETVGTTTWSEEPDDVEALAPAGRGEVWVGDIGDNLERRETVSVARVPVGRGDRSADPVTYELRYPDGPQDAESLLTHPRTGRLYVASKSILGGSLYEAPRRLSAERPNALRTLGQVVAMATDATFLPDGRHLVVRNYGRAVVYTFPVLERVAEIDLPPQQQGEGIAVDRRGRLLLSSEGAGSPVLLLAPPAEVQRVLAGRRPDAETVVPSPTSSPTEPSSEPTGTGPEAEVRETEIQRPVWPWLLGGVVGVLMIVVLLRSLRPR